MGEENGLRRNIYIADQISNKNFATVDFVSVFHRTDGPNSEIDLATRSSLDFDLCVCVGGGGGGGGGDIGRLSQGTHENRLTPVVL